MPKIARALSAIEISRITEKGLHPVGSVPGLALKVTGSGSRSWVLRTMIAGKRSDVGLGAYPGVTLAMARQKAAEAKETIKAGVSPIEQKKIARSSLKAAAAKAVTFRECACAYMAAHSPAWSLRHAQQFRNTLETYAYPVIADLLVRDVGKEHVLSILRPIWLVKATMASRLRARIEIVIDYAIQAGYRPDEPNPARLKNNLDKLLLTGKGQERVKGRDHFPALQLSDVGLFMSLLRQAGGIESQALQFCILTAARTNEVFGATWGEIDFDAKLWTVPAKRMKAGKEHRIPLSDAAIAILRRQPIHAGVDLIFPSYSGVKLYGMALTRVIHRLHDAEIRAGRKGFTDPKEDNRIATAHGMRSTFKDWAGERTNYPMHVTQMALAHTIGDKVEAAYRRGDLLDKRRLMMDDWAAFLSGPWKPADVIELRAKKTAT